MPAKYEAIPIENLIQTPSRLQTGRNEAIAAALTDALNEKAELGWTLVTSCKTANGTIFVFENAAEFAAFHVSSETIAD